MAKKAPAKVAAKPVAKKPVAKKAPAKPATKPAAKKAPAAKPAPAKVAAKPVAKKPVAKKAPAKPLTEVQKRALTDGSSNIKESRQELQKKASALRKTAKQNKVKFVEHDLRDMTKKENNNPIELEIGCGKGQFITTHTISNSDKNFIGMEKETTVVGVALKNTLNKVKDPKTLTNLKYFNIYAENLLSLFEENSIDKIYLNFSDP
ncbi:hypothetical protein FQA39_LY12960 [Lamprigera yunnana]|nr:hypothetical protein FQA39_LY12960 [Lamprigera yunnana]